VARLALLDTTARADTPEQSDRRRSLIALAQGGKFGTLADLMYPGLFHRDEPQLRQTFRLMLEQTGADAFVRQQRTIMSRPDSLADLPRIACPTLVLVGDADAVTPPERAREMAQAIPGARLVIVPDCGHMCALEQPAAVSRALDEWLS
jgi:pimeloyl-ACP methyl ester carboxylesterase